ncbi:hypothetical protein GCM10011506_20520 [Marivirga lumbricoides]|uniref:Uncharacterized protein n=2 Tax=Marivirga lumbricoides TaxID=1046115 RepID=A0ABQ1M5I6_9BACT|nr:hypothetical protein GCM10011506_20520 [Marivirga lumbricoides]
MLKVQTLRVLLSIKYLYTIIYNYIKRKVIKQYTSDFKNMSIDKKIKKVGEAISKSVSKLLKLVNKKASNKKILKQVEKVQVLNKEKKKLKKVSKIDNAETVDKAKSTVKPSKKTFAEKEAPSNNQIEEKLVKNRSSIAKSKEGRNNSQKVNKPVKTTTANDNDLKSEKSIDMNARTAIYKITEFDDLQKLNHFLKGEKRKTVLERAEARKNALSVN